jgi:hypothetical protein
MIAAATKEEANIIHLDLHIKYDTTSKFSNRNFASLKLQGLNFKYNPISLALQHGILFFITT